MSKPNTKMSKKNGMMIRRAQRGILAPGESNTGEHEKSKLHPNCQWAKTYLKGK